MNNPLFAFELNINQFVKGTLILVFTLLANFSASAFQGQQGVEIKEIGSPFIKNYLHTDYGAHEQSYRIAQNQNGLLYFTNVTGVIEFDGKQWAVDGNLSDDSFRGISIAENGRIYTASKSLLGYLEADSIGLLQFHSLNELLPVDEQRSTDIWDVQIVDDKVIYRSTFELLIYNTTTETFNSIKGEERYGQSDVIDGQYYVHGSVSGLMVFKGDRLEILPNSAELKKYTFRKILKFSDNELLLVSQNNGLLKYDFNSVSAWNTEVTNFLKDKKAFSGERIGHNYFAFGTITGGVVIIDKSGKLIQKFDESTGLPSNALVQDVFHDKDGNLWIAQHGSISHLIINTPFTVIDGRQGVEGYVLYTQKWRGKTYVSTATGLVEKSDNSPWQSLKDGYKPFTPVWDSNERVWMTLKHKDDFFAAGNSGLVQIMDTGVKPLYRGERLWAAVALKNSNYMVLGSIAGNLFTFQKKNGEWQFNGKIKGFNKQMDFLEQTEGGDIWMTDSGTGVFKIHLNERKDSVLSVKTYGIEEGLPQQEKNRVFRHRRGLYFATANGIYTYNRSLDRFESTGQFNPLLKDQYVFRFIEMANGDIFTSLNPGGKAILKKGTEGYSIQYSPFEKISSHNSEYVTGLGGNDVWIAGSGIRHFDWDFNQAKAKDFKALIRTVKVTTKGDSLIYAGLENQPTVNLGSRENALHFEYTSNYYEEIEKLDFESYLEGTEDTWAPWTSKADRNYTNLPSGDYTFHVRARNLYGQLSEEAKFTFTIATPWYLTYWALAFYLIFLVLIIWFIVRLNIKRLENEKVKLEQIVNERTEEIRNQKDQAEQDKELIQKQADRLKELDKVKSRFFANISHELRTPLTLINAPLESLVNSGKIDNEEVKETLIVAKKNGINLLSLVEEILDLAKLDAGKLSLVENPVRLHEFMGDMLKEYSATAKARNIAFEFDFEPSDDLTLVLDEKKSGKIIRNLLSNALKFTQTKIIVKVKENHGADGIEVLVEDDGVGIDISDLPHIFDRYYQSELPGKKAEGGTGIGLALAKELAELQKGELIVESKLEQGSKFTFRFPKKEAKPEHIKPLISTDNEGLDIALNDVLSKYAEVFSVDKPVLLITEDHPDMRNFVAQTLKPYFEILTAENGKVALHQLKTNEVDIVISDVMMPEMDGFELLAAIKADKTLHHVSVVMLTARAEMEDRLHALTLGIDDYLTKPFSSAVFLARIKNILENRIKVIRAFKELNKVVDDNAVDFVNDMSEEYGLSNRELEVMQLIAKRYTNAEIAEKLYVSNNTVKFHLKNLYNKIGVKNRAEVLGFLEVN
ncbi:response regulator [Roseivirga sp.]|uniref:response regulator n=1 Tax=Roseivirga sp. TaxID=1964215 RepID=UPI003B8CE9B9